MRNKKNTLAGVLSRGVLVAICHQHCLSGRLRVCEDEFLLRFWLHRLTQLGQILLDDFANDEIFETQILLFVGAPPQSIREFVRIVDEVVPPVELFVVLRTYRCRKINDELKSSLGCLVRLAGVLNRCPDHLLVCFFSFCSYNRSRYLYYSIKHNNYQ